MTTLAKTAALAAIVLSASAATAAADGYGFVRSNISQFGEPVWYYVSSTTSQKPFTNPKISGHTVLAVHFDAAHHGDQDGPLVGEEPATRGAAHREGVRDPGGRVEGEGGAEAGQQERRHPR